MITTRQTRCYRNTVTIIRPATAVSGSGDVGDQTFSVVATLVPCHYVLTLNDDDPSGVGRIKRRSALTEDGLHCPLDTDIQSGDLVFDTTAGSPTAGTWHKVEGTPKRIIGSSVRRTNKLSVQMMEEEHPPAGAVALV